MRKPSGPIIASATTLLIAVVLSAAAALSYLSANKWVDHTLVVQHQTDEWVASLLDMQNSVRGYVLSNDAAFLETYSAASDRERDDVARLKALVADNPAQEHNVDVADADARLTMDLLAATTRAMQAGRTADAVGRVASGAGKHSMDVFREDAGRIRDEEELLLSERRAHAARSAQFMLAAGAILMLIAGSFLVFASRVQLRRADEIEAVAMDAQRRLDALSSIASAFAVARTQSQVASAVVEHGMRAAGADTCTLYTLDDDGTTLALVGEGGVAKEVVDKIRHITESSVTSATFETLRSGDALWAETEADYQKLFPALATTKAEGRRAKAFWSVPLFVEGDPIGLLGMGFYEPRTFSSVEKSFIATLAQQCAQALVRAARFEGEDEAQRWFATTLHSIGDAVIATDPQGRVTFVNAVAERLTGWPMAEARGRGLDEVFCIFSEQTRKVVENPVEKVLREGVTVGLANHTVLRSRRGAERAIDDSAAPIRDAAGKLFGVVLVFRDVTDEKRTQARRDFLTRAGEALVSSLDYRTTLATVARFAVPELADWCAVDLLVEGEKHPKQLAVAHVDPAKVQLAKDLGERYPPDWNAKTGLPEVMRSGKSELYPELPAELLEAGARDAEHLRIIKALHLESAMVVPLRLEERVLGAMTFIYADSGRRYSQADLEFAEDFARRAALAIARSTAVAELERARERERSLREQAEQANRAKDEFLATVSHELRTPMTSILGWTVILRGRKLQDDLDHPLSIIERNARAQTKLIEEVLDVSRIISGKLVLDLGPVNVAEVIRASVESMVPAAQGKAISIRTEIADESMTISADANRVQQVVWNLLANAVKFTPQGGEVVIRAHKERSSIYISVTDTGEGIRAEMVARVFEPFQQADASTTRRHGGLGLGLAIVKYLVDAHGGDVKVESPGEGKGATFTVCLPARSPVPAIAVPERAHQILPRLDGLRVLVVDDEDDARMLVGALLRDYGAEVQLASSANEALAMFAAGGLDVIVSDIAMPQMDGYAFIRKVRTLPARAGGRTPAIALTAFARDEDAKRAFAAGYQRHVTKPIEPSQLVTVVANLGGRTQDAS